MSNPDPHLENALIKTRSFLIRSFEKIRDKANKTYATQYNEALKIPLTTDLSRAARQNALDRASRDLEYELAQANAFLDALKLLESLKILNHS